MIPSHFPLDRTPKPVEVESKISRVGDLKNVQIPRIKTGIWNVDRLLGGEEDPGLPKGFVFQLVGPPGIGKSTICAEIANALWDDCLYVTSEETKERIGRRCKRCRMSHADRIRVAETQDLSEAKEVIRESKAEVVIMDSLQGLRLHVMKGQKEGDFSPRKQSKHTQNTVRDVAFDLISEARDRKCTMFLLGHVTKSGDLAGLREIEHMVDAVVYFELGEKDPTTIYRTMRNSKNRESDTNTKIWFEMTSKGLIPCDPPKLKKGTQKEALEGIDREIQMKLRSRQSYEAETDEEHEDNVPDHLHEE